MIAQKSVQIIESRCARSRAATQIAVVTVPRIRSAIAQNQSENDVAVPTAYPPKIVGSAVQTKRTTFTRRSVAGGEDAFSPEPGLLVAPMRSESDICGGEPVNRRLDHVQARVLFVDGIRPGEEQRSEADNDQRLKANNHFHHDAPPTPLDGLGAHGAQEL